MSAAPEPVRFGDGQLVHWNGQRDCFRAPTLSQVVEKQVECLRAHTEDAGEVHQGAEDAGEVHQSTEWDYLKGPERDCQRAPDDYNAGCMELSLGEEE